MPLGINTRKRKGKMKQKRKKHNNHWWTPEAIRRKQTAYGQIRSVNPLKAELNPTFHLLALLGAHHIFHVSGLTL